MLKHRDRRSDAAWHQNRPPAARSPVQGLRASSLAWAQLELRVCAALLVGDLALAITIPVLVEYGP